MLLIELIYDVLVDDLNAALTKRNFDDTSIGLRVWPPLLVVS